MSAVRALDLTGGILQATASASEIEELVARARDGDRDAFERLVLVTSPATYGLALRLVGNEHDARDVVQDAYLRAFRSLKRFRGEASFGTWLHRITVNCAASHLKRRSRAAHDQLDDFGDWAVLVDERSERDPETAASTADDRGRLVSALADLPDQQRMVVVLRDVYDLSHREIARELGISQAAAKVRLHRARRRLREQLFPSRRDLAELSPDTGMIASDGHRQGARAGVDVDVAGQRSIGELGSP